MTVYVLQYDADTGGREDWNVFYTPLEVFLTPELRDARKAYISANKPNLEFHETDIEVSEVADAPLGQSY